MTYRHEQHGIQNHQAMTFDGISSALPCLARDGP
jgi:hypothetical protein